MKRLNGQVRSDQIMQRYLNLRIDIQHSAIQKLPTKFHVNWAIEPRVLTVDAQIASWHLIIFAIYLHIETGISKSFEVPVFLFGTLHSNILYMICGKYC